MATRYCTECCLAFPLRYRQCPICSTRCKVRYGAEPISPERARKLARAYEFERFYTRRERQRSGPTPEELGSQDAQREIQERRERGAR